MIGGYKEKPLESGEIIRRNVGLLMIKPDAIDLGVEDHIVAEFCGRLHGIAQIDYAVAVKISTVRQIHAIYPRQEENIYQMLCRNLLNREAILISFRGGPHIDLQRKLKEIKGPSMWHWTERMLHGDTNPDRFIRGWLPIPGSSDLWESIIKKIQAGARMTEEEFVVYSQNLIHTPDTVNESQGLLEFFPKNIRKKISG